MMTAILKHLQDWSPDIAQALAQQQQLTLTDAHWEIINAIRDFYSQ
ncbi:MAG: TusE/DsrC/DsvC family sulfur relay protein [Moraxellaceae bacterium]|nr:TusE/DsrC/DsvC family sulfur relay protein [Moraxellaceae bacterium]